MVLIFQSVDETLKCDQHSNHAMKAIELHVSMVLFIMLCRVVLTFETVEEILKCDH